MPLDPQAQALMDEIVAAGAPPRHLLPVEEGRQVFLKTALRLGLTPEANSGVTIEDREIAGPGGPIPLRLYRPVGIGPLPAMVYFHGGGWTFGSLDSHHNICHYLAQKSGNLVIAAHYRLAPEAKFPAAVEDAWAATNWTAQNAAELGLDPSRLGVGGDSAGGNLAAVVTLLARERGGPPLSCQLLIFPVTDHYSSGHPAYQECGTGYFLSRDTMVWFWNNYVEDETEAASPLASPLRAALSGLPPALVIVAEYDPLRDDGNLYAEKLLAAGVPTRKAYFPNQMHAFVSHAGRIDQGREALDLAAAFMRDKGRG